MRYLYTFILLLSLNISSDNLYYFEDEYDENRFNNLIKDIRCPKCCLLYTSDAADED